jgi:hypothetical protein
MHWILLEVGRRALLTTTMNVWVPYWLGFLGQMNDSDFLSSFAKITVFQYVTPCSLVDRFQRLEEI